MLIIESIFIVASSNTKNMKSHENVLEMFREWVLLGKITYLTLAYILNRILKELNVRFYLKYFYKLYANSCKTISPEIFHTMSYIEMDHSK